MADAYAACQKRFEYSHVKKLMPVVTPEALARGIYAHNLMEIFFTAIKEGESHETAKSITLLNAADDPKYFNKIWNRIEYFLDEIYPTLGWLEIISIERTYRLDVGDKFQFPFTVDLVVRMADGIVYAIDFKFGADAYDEQMLKMYPQLPKYVGGLRVLGMQKLLEHEVPTKAMYVFIRSRHNIADKNKFVEIHPVEVSDARIRNSFIEQDQTATAIISHLESNRPFIRTFNNNCKYCPFIELCVAEMNGRDPEEIKTMEAVLYKENSYGYEELEIA
jgi:hypothetical protein